MTGFSEFYLELPANEHHRTPRCHPYVTRSGDARNPTAKRPLWKGKPAMMIEPIEPTAVYTLAEASRVTKIGETSLRKLARTGEIRCIRVGRKVLRFMGSDLIAFLRAGGTEKPINAVPDQVRRRPSAVA